MRMRIPKGNPPKVETRPDKRIRQVRHYKLITPLFGGGVEPNRADPITIVRGTEIRGQLRFWWRATHGGKFEGNLKAMRIEEESIWGSAAAKDRPGPSDVVISVEIINPGKPFRPRTREEKVLLNIGHFRSPYSYVAFPLRDDHSNPSILQDIEFRLNINYSPKWEESVAASLWAWETFGGLGARTRRGFGALQLVSVDNKEAELPTLNRMREWISQGLKKHVTLGPWPKDVPHLTQDASFVLTPNDSRLNSIEAWRHLIDKLKKFRQARKPDKEGRPYGRSKWPEPDEIRRLTNTNAPQHTPRHPVRKFPRGQFGLPIIFHFKDEKQGDPPQSTLQGAEHDRFASSMILRPLACTNSAVGLVLRLSSPQSPPNGYVLNFDNQTHTVQVQGLTNSEAQKIEPLDGEPDVLRAFLNFLRT